MYFYKTVVTELKNITFLDILFLSLFSKVLFGGKSGTQETVACWISVTSTLQPTYDHHIFNNGEDEDRFLNSSNEVKILDFFLHPLSSLFSGHSSRHPQYSGAGDFLLDLSL